MLGRVASLWRHPIKAHGAEPVEAADFSAGETMPWDRVWGIAHEGARFGPGPIDWVSAANFSRGAKSPALMAIRAQTDDALGRITLSHPDANTITVDPDDPVDAKRLVEWVLPLADPARARPSHIVRGQHNGLTDSSFASVAILNRASLAALSERIGTPLAEERFRGNIWLEGLDPWAEFELLGKVLRIGTAAFAVRERITRCMATAANPETGRIDADTLRTLESSWNHKDFGVYAEVTEGGRVAVGDIAEIA